MKLIRCHIENFGKFTEMDVAFQPGCNVICRENGAGKSTLAAFIRVMLFGFDNERARKTEDREREQYRPWQHGVYGGSLEFEADGKVYVISRTFGQKDKDDTFDLREKETNLVSRDFTERVGEELFLLDRDSFLRTVFISQNDCAARTTDRISAKIGNLAENTDDINNYEAVDKKLSDLMNRMTPSRATGSIKKMELEAAKRRERVRAGSDIGPAMDRIMAYTRELKEEQAGLRREQAALYEQQKTVSRYKDVQADKEKYADLCRETEERTAAAEAERAYFPGRIPDPEELQRHLADSAGLSAAEEKRKIYQLTEEEKYAADRLERLFADGCPSEEQIRAGRERLKELHETELLMARNRMSREDAARLSEYRRRFGEAVPQEADIRKAIASWQERTDKKNGLSTRKLTLETLEQIAAQQAESKKEGKRDTGRSRTILLFSAAVFLVLAGVACITLGYGAVGAGLLAAGILPVFAALILIKKGGSAVRSDSPRSSGQKTVQQEDTEADSADSPQLAQFRAEIAGDEAYIAETEEQIAWFLSSAGLNYEEERVLDQLYRLKAETEEYRLLRSREKSIREQNLEEKKESLTAKLRNLCGRFYSVSPGNENFDAVLSRLEEDVREYRRLREKKDQYAAAERLDEKLKEGLRDYLKALSMSPGENLNSQFADVRNHLQAYQAAVGELTRARAEQADFEKGRDMEKFLRTDSGMPGQLPSLEALGGRLEVISARLAEIEGNLNDYNRQIDDLRERMEQTAEEEQALADLQEKISADRRKYELLGKTREYLARARESFTARYTGPLMESFGKYYRILAREEAKRYHLDANIRLTVDELGQQRQLHSFSTGYQDLIGICMRMALVDAMYREEKPFVIFDDPFVNLDSGKVAGGLEFLDEIAKEYQILYFTCHESRAGGKALSANGSSVTGYSFFRTAGKQS